MVMMGEAFGVAETVGVSATLGAIERGIAVIMGLGG
jgi:hypothetical protein